MARERSLIKAGFLNVEDADIKALYCYTKASEMDVADTLLAEAFDTQIEPKANSYSCLLFTSPRPRDS